MCKPRQSFTPELTVCILLIFGVIGAWTGFFLFFDHSAGERAAFWFMRNHLSLGEPPDFVLHIAGQGVPQPVEILITWRELQLSLVMALTLIAGLIWLAYRLWKAEAPHPA
jgi:hypothetical protein